MLRIKQLCIFLYSVCKYRVSIVHHGWIYGKPHTYCDVQFMNFDFVLLLQIWESWWSMQLEILNENLLACFRKPKKKGPQWVFWQDNNPKVMANSKKTNSLSTRTTEKNMFILVLGGELKWKEHQDSGELRLPVLSFCTPTLKYKMRKLSAGKTGLYSKY